MRHPAIFICTLLFFLPFSKADALEIKSLRFGGDALKQRIVLEMDQAVDYTSFTTREPNRIIIDLPDFKWSIKNMQKPVSSGVIEIRHGMVGAGKSRIVLDTRAPAIILSSFLIPQDKIQPWRLVIDFKNADQNSDSAATAAAAQISAQPQPFTQPVSREASHEGSLGTLVIKSKKIIPAHQKIEPPAQPSAKDKLKKFVETAVITTPYQPKPIPDFEEPVVNQDDNDAPAQSPKTALKSLQKPLIIIDPGHGGQDPGAKAANGIYEKSIVLAIGLELKKTLEKSGKYRVAMTRSTDVFIPLHDRVKFARKQGGDLFISLHADSMPNPDTSGASVYTLSNTASDKETEKLAERENKSDAIAGVNLSSQDADVANILIDLVSRDTMNQSKYLANTVVGSFENNDVNILPRAPHRSAGFAVLKAMDIPSILVENGYLTNLNEAQRLSSQDYRQRIALALKASVDSYFTKIAHLDSR